MQFTHFLATISFEQDQFFYVGEVWTIFVSTFTEMQLSPFKCWKSDSLQPSCYFKALSSIDYRELENESMDMVLPQINKTLSTFLTF